MWGHLQVKKLFYNFSLGQVFHFSDVTYHKRIKCSPSFEQKLERTCKVCEMEFYYRTVFFIEPFLQGLWKGTLISTESEAAHECKAWLWSSGSTLSWLWEACQIPWHAYEGDNYIDSQVSFYLDWKVQHAKEGRPEPIKCSIEGCDILVNNNDMSTSQTWTTSFRWTWRIWRCTWQPILGRRSSVVCVDGG